MIPRNDNLEYDALDLVRSHQGGCKCKRSPPHCDCCVSMRVFRLPINGKVKSVRWFTTAAQVQKHQAKSYRVNLYWRHLNKTFKSFQMVSHEPTLKILNGNGAFCLKKKMAIIKWFKKENNSWENSEHLSWRPIQPIKERLSRAHTLTYLFVCVRYDSV